MSSPLRVGLLAEIWVLKSAGEVRYDGKIMNQGGASKSVALFVTAADALHEAIKDYKQKKQNGQRS